jgi:hypothetical protein
MAQFEAIVSLGQGRTLVEIGGKVTLVADRTNDRSKL